LALKAKALTFQPSKVAKDILEIILFASLLKNKMSVRPVVRLI